MHHDLLRLARELVDRNPGAPIEAELRRAVSTAYYALFHLLVFEAMARCISDPALRARVARAFQHGSMKEFCRSYRRPDTNSIGSVVPAQLRQIAFEFIALQDARHQADYDTGVSVTHGQADIDVMRAETAFLDWAAIQSHPEATNFLQELFCRSIMKRP
jgi:uncharacterized protein (UPF0332 family)